MSKDVTSIMHFLLRQVRLRAGWHMALCLGLSQPVGMHQIECLKPLPVIR